MYGTIKFVSARDSFTDIGISFDADLNPQVLNQKSFCPASLMADAVGNTEMYEVHRYIGHVNDRHLFRTFGCNNPPQVESKIFFRSWWTDHEIDLIQDTKLNWVLMEYPSNGEHDHCPLTWKKISANGPEKFGYFADSVWISTEGYERFIHNDELHLRAGFTK